MARIKAMSVAELRDAIAANGAAFWQDGYDRERALESYALRGELGRRCPDDPEVQRERALWARDARY